MGNCGLKPKVLSEAEAPVPEELKISLLEDKKIDAAKSLSNLFLQDKADKKMEDEKTTPEKMSVAEDLKTTLTEAISPTKETNSLVTETISPGKEAKTPVTETKVPADDQKVRNEEAVRGHKVIEDATVKETETEVKPEEVRREAAAQ